MLVADEAGVVDALASVTSSVVVPEYPIAGSARVNGRRPATFGPTRMVDRWRETPDQRVVEVVHAVERNRSAHRGRRAGG